MIFAENRSSNNIRIQYLDTYFANNRCPEMDENIIVTTFLPRALIVVRYGSLDTLIKLPRFYPPRFYLSKFNPGRFYPPRFYLLRFYPGRLI